MRDFKNVRVSFPALRMDWKGSKHRYYNHYFTHIAGLFEHAGCGVSYYEPKDDIPNWGNPQVTINGTVCVFDIYDHLMPMNFTERQLDVVDVIFKNQWHPTRCSELFDLYPDHSIFGFCPQTFYDWDEYFAIAETPYECSGPFLWMQRKHPNRQARMGTVKAVLGSGVFQVQKGFVPRSHYLAMVQRTSGNVIVPGVSNEVMDKAILQSFGLGCLVISSNLCAQLPWETEFVAGEDFLNVGDTYMEDIEASLHWILGNPREAEKIGARAKAKFQASCTPKSAVSWVLRCIEESKS